jgi:hypothetical protein
MMRGSQRSHPAFPDTPFIYHKDPPVPSQNSAAWARRLVMARRADDVLDDASSPSLTLETMSTRA